MMTRLVSGLAKVDRLSGKLESIDAKTFAAAKLSALKASAACLQQNYTAAHDYRAEMEDIVLSTSGINEYDVRTFENYDYMDERMDTFLNSPEAKDMLHVPQDVPFRTDSQLAVALYDDTMRSQADKIPFLLEHIRVLLYQVSRCGMTSLPEIDLYWHISGSV